MLVTADNCFSDPTKLREVNDTVFANPLFTVPILNFTDTTDYRNSTKGIPMCYQVSGQADKYLNYISDDCVSVNAYYRLALDPSRQVIQKIGVVATDRGNDCHYVQVEVNASGICIATIDGQTLDNNDTRILGLSVSHRNKIVRIDVPNCAPPNERLVFWINCQKALVSNMEQSFIRFIMNRGLQQRPTAHGLVGEFFIHYQVYLYTVIPCLRYMTRKTFFHGMSALVIRG